MTTPSRIDEILHEMEQDPESAQELRPRILGQEISMLPAAVAQNQGLIIRLVERQVELATAVNTALEAVISVVSQTGDKLATALEANGQRLEGVKSALAELREECQRIRESLGQVLTDVKRAHSDVAETKASVKQLRSEVAETKADVKQLQSDVRRIDGRLDRGFGTN